MSSCHRFLFISKTALKTTRVRGRGKYSHHNNPLDLQRNLSFSDRARHVSVDLQATDFVAEESDSYEFVPVRGVGWHSSPESMVGINVDHYSVVEDHGYPKHVFCRDVYLIHVGREPGMEEGVVVHSVLKHSSVDWDERLARVGRGGLLDSMEECTLVNVRRQLLRV